MVVAWGAPGLADGFGGPDGAFCGPDEGDSTPKFLNKKYLD